MRKEYECGYTASCMPTHYDLSFLEGTTKVEGFMEAPIDGKYIAKTVMVEQPYEDNIIKLFSRYRSVAPHYAYTAVVTGKDKKPLEYLILRFGAH